MGLVHVAKGADYSAIAVDRLGVFTTVDSGLQALHEMRISSAVGRRNRGSGNAASIQGSPTFASDSLPVSSGQGLTFGVSPVGINHTVAFALKIKNGGTTSDYAVGVWSAAIATAGGIYVNHYNRRVTLNAISFPAGSVPPLSGYNIIAASIDFTSPSDGVLELFVAVLESGVSLRLYHPRLGTVATTSATGRDFTVNNPGAFRTFPNLASAAAYDESLFAYWNRAITLAEVNTFYGDMKSYFAEQGITL